MEATFWCGRGVVAGVERAGHPLHFRSAANPPELITSSPLNPLLLSCSNSGCGVASLRPHPGSHPWPGALSLCTDSTIFPWPHCLQPPFVCLPAVISAMAGAAYAWCTIGPIKSVPVGKE